MEDFHPHGMKHWDSAEIGGQPPVALEKNNYPLLVINPAVSTCLVEKTSSKNSLWQGLSSAECECHRSAELN